MRIGGIALLTLSLALGAAGCKMTSPLVGPTYLQSRATPKDDAALVYVYRFSAEPKAAAATILVDGKELVALEQRAFTWFYAAPGHHDLGARWAPVTGQHPAHLTLEAEAGRTYFVELTGVHRVTGSAEIISSTLSSRARDAAEPRLERCGLQPRPEAATP